MPVRCMMDIPNHSVINYDGVLYSCPGLIGRRDFAIGDITDEPGGSNCKAGGNLVPAPGNWHNETCLACAYLPLCFGGCRYMTLLNTGSMQGVDCRKSYYDAVLEPLVLQDIRYKVKA